MSKRAMEDLRRLLCDELDEIARKGELGAGDLDIAHKLTDTIKNIDKIEMLEDGADYSQMGEWEADMRGVYGRGASNASSRRHLVRAHYSRGEGADELREQLRELMRDARDDRQREAIRRCMDELGE